MPAEPPANPACVGSLGPTGAARSRQARKTLEKSGISGGKCPKPRAILGRSSRAQFPPFWTHPILKRGPRVIPGRRQGHLPQSRSRRRREGRREDHPRHDLRVLSSAHSLERHDGARAGGQRRQRRPAARHRRRRGRAAVRQARRRQDRQPHQLEGPLQGQLRQDAQRLDRRHGRRAEEPDVPGQVQEPLVPREADARSRQVAHRLGSVRGDERDARSRSRTGSRRRSNAASR